MEQPVRIGMIGAGAFPQRVQLPTLQRIAGVEVVALADANAERARACAAEFGIATVYSNYEELLAGGGLDAVLVTTPNATHAPIAMAALKAGCHVLVEKPMAINGDQAQAMADLARQQRKVLTIDLHQRFAAAHQLMRERIGQGELGEIYHAHATWIRRAGIPGYGSWFTTAALSGGGALMDIGVHILDLALWMLDEPRVLTVSALTSSLLGQSGQGRGQWGIDRGTSGPFDVDDNVTALLRCANNLAITLDVAWASHAPAHQRLQFHGSQAGAIAEQHERNPLSLTFYRENQGEPVDETPELPAQAMPSPEGLLRGFIDSIRTGAPAPVPAEAGVRLARLCDAIYESARTGQEVQLNK